MQKFIEGVGVFLLVSLIIKLSVNYVLSPVFITFLFGAAHLTYIKAVLFYGLSNLVFKDNLMALKEAVNGKNAQ